MAGGTGAAAQAAPRAGTSPRREQQRALIVAAAMDLFEQDGYVAATVNAIAAAAGVSRRTFFHYFRSKEDVVFPDHARLVEQVAGLLAESGDGPVDTVCRALQLVFTSYVADEAVALRRYRLTRATPELRARETAWVHRYQLLFSRYLDEKIGQQPQGRLTAEAVSASLVAGHNHVLRAWLKRGGGGDPVGELTEALAWLRRSVGFARRGGEPPRVLVAVFDDDAAVDDILRTIRQAKATT